MICLYRILLPKEKGCILTMAGHFFWNWIISSLKHWTTDRRNRQEEDLNQIRPAKHDAEVAGNMKHYGFDGYDGTKVSRDSAADESFIKTIKKNIKSRRGNFSKTEGV